MVVVATLVGVACSDPIAGNDSARGDYTLVSVNTTQLPVVVSDDGTTQIEVTGGSARLRADGSCDVRRELRTTTGGSNTTDTDAHDCTWTRNGAALFLTLSDGGVYPGTWDETALTLDLLIEGEQHLFAR